MTSKDELLQYRLFALALLALLIAFTWFSFTATGTDAAPAPTATPAPMVTPTPENHNHCMMLTDGICYIIYPANCVPGTPEVYGSESMGVPVTCGTVKGK